MVAVDPTRHDEWVDEHLDAADDLWHPDLIDEARRQEQAELERRYAIARRLKEHPDREAQAQGRRLEAGLDEEVAARVQAERDNGGPTLNLHVLERFDERL